MKAAQYSDYGGPEVIKINEIEVPQPKAGQVLVKIEAVALNPFDAKLRQGKMKDSIPLQFPVTIAADFAGTVTAVAADVTELKVGDEIYGSCIVLGGGSGAAAEFAAANASSSARRPANVTPEEAAAVVLVGVSAYDVVAKLHLGPGKKVLIHGGAGGIGSTAIHYAKSLGAYVASTARGDEKDFVSGRGADQVIDYETEKFEDVLHDFDAVFDTVGGETYERSFQVLKPGGIIVSMVAKPNEELAQQRSVSAILQSTKINSETLQHLRELVEQKAITPKIDQVFPLEQTAAAFERLETGYPKGKVVIKIQ